MEEFKLESKDIWNAIILIAVGMIVVAGFMMIDEFTSARKSCENIGGEFEYNFPIDYFCDDKPFFKYDDGWDYEREINLSSIFFP